MVENKQDLGLSILTSSAVFGAWSAWSSSLFTVATFVDDEVKYKNAKLAMDLGMVTAVAIGGGIYLVYHEKGKVAAVAAVVTGGILYLAYWLKLKQNPNLFGFMSGHKTNNTIKSIDTKNIRKVPYAPPSLGESKGEPKGEWIPLSQEELHAARQFIDSIPIRTSYIDIVREP